MKTTVPNPLFAKDQVISYCIDFLRNRHLYFS